MSAGERSGLLEGELPNYRLDGRTAFVTGSSRGIGRSIALGLAWAGADVAISCNTGGAAAEEVVELIRGMGRKAAYYAHNVALESEVEAMCAEVKRDFGAIDILVNNAGITRDRSFKKLTKEAWDEVINTDLTSVFLVTKQFIDEMAERGWGRVVNMSSVVGEIGNFGQANYAAAKAGLIGLTKTLAREYARKGVTVNAVAPGFIRTRMTEPIPEKALEQVLGMTPVGRLGEPVEVAAGVVYLVSPSAGFVTGAVLDINGGLSM
ncbi:MAG: beta-ketoacyl-ACP reductase [Isosphaeraceae bacterium]|jgi:NAD(P)-dependent dehydrogenase (short-subunit alcohol dehydrogenase family)|nr:MAG: beta-ketoacyl-ACP reductase [Isosphaeraceae bacterium]